MRRRAGRARYGPRGGSGDLVEQPPIHDQVERIIRRLYLDRTEQPIPHARDSLPGGMGRFHRAVPGHERQGLVAVMPLAEHECQLARLTRSQFHHDLQRTAWIEAMTGLT